MATKEEEPGIGTELESRHVYGSASGVHSEVSPGVRTKEAEGGIGTPSNHPHASGRAIEGS